MTDYISDLIDLGDPSAKVTEVIQDDDTKYVFIEKKVACMFCPLCDRRMKSKGKRIKQINHPVFQDGFKLILAVTVRKWYCESCSYYDHDHYTFVEDGKRNTSLVPLLILDKMKDIGRTAASVAQDLNVSDTYVFETFMQYVSLPRLPLPDILSIDEVYMKFDKANLYPVILMDFRTGQIIDLLPNRYTQTLEDYFLHIPREERNKVNIIISDMYDTYLDLAERYFPNASIVFCLHDGCEGRKNMSRENEKAKEYYRNEER